MPATKALSFSVVINIIGINPYVFVPDKILNAIFKQAGRDKSPIPIKGKINGQPYTQTLMKYKGAWRLYINTTMLKDSPKRIGETIKVTIQYDPATREVSMHPNLHKALSKDRLAKKAFESLPPSQQKEIIKYISLLKTEVSVNRNLERIMRYLRGEGSFYGRELKKPKVR